jgi:Phytanoyl-CoA dioxygenase (PhyH)
MTAYQTKKPGFRIAEDVLSAEECEALISNLSNAKVSKGRAGARHLMGVPEVARLARDTRLLDIARCELRTKPFPFRVTLFEKSGKANWLVVWHQDTALPLRARFDAPGWGPWSEKAGVPYAHAPASALSRIVALRVHLDASTTDNGSLRIVPHSHVLGILSDEEIGSVAKEHGFVECLVPKGGILTMSPLIIHSSSKARVDAPRRVLHIEYADSQSLGQGIELAVA